jgi:hypothetical protein
VLVQLHCRLGPLHLLLHDQGHLVQIQAAEAAL